MSGEWPVVPFGTLAANDKGAIAIGPFGSRMKSNVYVTRGVPVIRGTNISGSRWLKGEWVHVSEEFAAGIPNCIAKPGDLVFPHRGSIGEVALIEPHHGEMVLSSSMMKFRPDRSRAYSMYLYYYFRSSEGRSEILRFSSQVGTPGIGQPLSSLRQFRVRLPELIEQRAIAHILGVLDEKIELNRQMNHTLERMAQALFKSWFIDFDPVVYNVVQAENPIPERFQATAERYRQNPEAQTLPRDLLALFPDRFESSELGEIPVGWEKKQIGDVVRCVGGATPSTKNPDFWDDGTHPFLTPKDMSSLTSPIMVDTARHITDAGVQKISSKAIRPGAVMLSSRAPIGYLGINEVSTSINQGVIAMICDGPLPNYYVLLWTKANMETIKGKSGGTTFAEISKKNFRPIPILVPPQDVLDRFSEYVAPIYQQISANVIANQSLAETRDTLLPKLISGDLRVPDHLLGAAQEENHEQFERY